MDYYEESKHDVVRNNLLSNQDNNPQLLKSRTNKSSIKETRFFFIVTVILQNCSVELDQDGPNDTVEAKHTGKTDVENVVQAWPCKDLETEKEVEDSSK